MALVPLGQPSAEPEVLAVDQTVPEADSAVPSEGAVDSAPAADLAPSVEAPADPLPLILGVVQDWIAASYKTAPPVSQLHFSLHLMAQMADLEERLSALG